LSREADLPEVLNENARTHVIEGSFDIEEDDKDKSPDQEGRMYSIGKS